MLQILRDPDGWKLYYRTHPMYGEVRVRLIAPPAYSEAYVDGRLCVALNLLEALELALGIERKASDPQ